jgi:iron complex transport system permease protein
MLRRRVLLLAILTGLSALALAIALASGSANLGAAATWQALTGNAPENIENLVWNLRAPRALTAFGVGGLLAVAGVLMQVLLRNPLAEPYILGTSGGAAVAALSAMMLGLGSALVDLAAFGGALAATLLVFSIAQGTGSWTPTRLLLTGVVLAAGFSAATTLLLALTPEQNLRGMLFWLMGDLSFVRSPVRSLALLALITAIGAVFARHLNVLARGELQAAIVGLRVAAFRLAIFAVTSLAGSDHRIVLPASALAGGSLLVVADTLARTIIAPRQLPVGAVTAAIGVPLFLYLMSRSRADFTRA